MVSCLDNRAAGINFIQMSHSHLDERPRLLKGIGIRDSNKY